MNDNVQTTRKVYEAPTDWALMSPIFSSHVKRIGWTRTLSGGLPMYTCIPLLVIMHVTTCVAGYQWLMRPLLNLPKVKWRNHVIIDRQRIDGMNWFDAFNCMFCGYANGLTVMANIEIDHLSRVDLKQISPGRKALFAALSLVFVPLLLVFELGLQIIYNILVSRPLGMHRVSLAEAGHLLKKTHYAEQFNAPAQQFVRAAKSLVLRFALALEQIESSWCPLKHLERREGIVYPGHHDKFFGPHEIEQMRHALLTKGTVSDRHPTW